MIIIPKKINIKFTFLFMILGGVVAYITLQSMGIRVKNINVTQQNNMYSDADNGTNYNIVRLGGYHYIKPILYAEEKNESQQYSNLKTDINSLIEKFKADGILNSASVYVRNFKYGDWIELNPQEAFQPGSLLKVPILFTYLKMNENKPGLLNSSIICDRIEKNLPNQNITTKTIKVGQKYSVKELLHYMIANSDNNATFLLGEYMDMQVYNRVFTDLGLSIEHMDNRELFHITARQYSVFFKVLFNATYLDNKDSEFAASLLAQCDFKDGILKEMPKNVIVAHKFGEAGTDDMHELSESGIVFLDDNPYIITIMTKGPQLKKLSNVISEISRLVYDKMTTNK